MPGDNVSDDRDLAAGGFSTWLVDVQAAIRGERGSDVPCGGCTACCTSSQFVHIGPDEADTLAHIPSELLFPAPRLPPGHVLLGYDERGHCPMLVDNRCSIYEHRPRTCRAYDCRVFPAAGVEPEVADKPLIARQAARWTFSTATDADRNLQGAVQAAARFLTGTAPMNATQRAVLAIEIHEAFLGGGDAGRFAEDDPDPALVDDVRRRIQRQDRPGSAGGALGEAGGQRGDDDGRGHQVGEHEGALGGGAGR